MTLDKKKVLSGLTSTLGGIELPGTKKIFALPNDLVFVVDTRDNIEQLHDLSKGNGHEPYMIEKMMEFSRENETYVEVGGHYGDFSLRMSQKLGLDGSIYAFEPGRNLFECFAISVALNGITNIKLENLAVFDKVQEIGFSENTQVSLMGHVTKPDGKYTKKIMATTLDSYFKGKEPTVDIIRLDAEGSECKVLRGAKKIIESSPDIRLFIEWQSALLDRHEEEAQQRKCLTELIDEGFILLNILEFDRNCGNLNYRFTLNDLIGARVLEFLAIKENALKKFIELEVSNDYKEQCANKLLLTSAMNNNSQSLELAISEGAEVNYIHSIGATALYMASQGDFLEVTKALIGNGASTNISTTTGIPPLCMAAQNKNTPMVKLLVESGTDIEAHYSNNATALYLAAHKGGFEVVEFLLSRGANKNVVVNGLNAFERSVVDKHYDIAKLLADDTEVFCHAIPEMVANNDYAELCGKVEISIDGQ